MQKIIRYVNTMDRDALPDRITTFVVLDCIKRMGKLLFTTCDIADALLAAGNYQGVEYSKLERSVRQSVVWLVYRGMAIKIDAPKKKITKAGNTSWPDEYRIIRWQPQPKAKPEPKPVAEVDYAALNRVFLRCGC